MKPVLLDGFCKAGGATKGYQRAGFYVVGVDIEPQPHFCGDEFIQADMLTFPLEGYDAIHISPPCQAYSAGGRMRNGFAKEHPKLIEPMRARLLEWGGPYVIENVPEAPLLNPVRLCGSQFGLEVRRHRCFESNFLLFSSACTHQWQDLVVGVYGDHPEHSVIRKGHPAVRARDVAHAQTALGIDWMPLWSELKEAIPLAYAQFIGEQLMAVLDRERTKA